ncbi:MAG: YhbY family RNA-binding protein [Acidobacteriota bacterium]
MLTSSQRKRLRGLAHALKPSVHIGHGGLSDALLTQLDAELDHHELIKVKFVDFKDQKREACDEIGAALHSETVGIIGHIAILFRQSRDPEKRRIEIDDL